MRWTLSYFALLEIVGMVTVAKPMYCVNSSMSWGIRPSGHFQKWSFTCNQGIRL